MIAPLDLQRNFFMYNLNGRRIQAADQPRSICSTVRNIYIIYIYHIF